MASIIFCIPGLKESQAYPVHLNAKDGPGIMQLLHLPVLATYQFAPEQLPLLASAIADHIGYEGAAANIASRPYRYSMEEVSVAEYIQRTLKGLATLIHHSMSTGLPLEWTTE